MKVNSADQSAAWHKASRPASRARGSRHGAAQQTAATTPTRDDPTATTHTNACTYTRAGGKKAGSPAAAGGAHRHRLAGKRPPPGQPAAHHTLATNRDMRIDASTAALALHRFFAASFVWGASKGRGTGGQDQGPRVAAAKEIQPAHNAGQGSRRPRHTTADMQARAMGRK